MEKSSLGGHLENVISQFNKIKLLRDYSGSEKAKIFNAIYSLEGSAEVIINIINKYNLLSGLNEAREVVILLKPINSLGNRVEIAIAHGNGFLNDDNTPDAIARTLKTINLLNNNFERMVNIARKHGFLRGKDIHEVLDILDVIGDLGEKAEDVCRNASIFGLTENCQDLV